jgi:cytochrome c biogenesis protein CcmG/thiol:disulfide interchange protein DsbE
MPKRLLTAWRWAIVPVVAVPLAWLLFTGLGRDPRLIPSPLVGQPLPVLSGTTLDGASFTTASLAGRPALINVWASWCAPCVTEHPLLLDAARSHGDELLLVGLVYHDTPEAARAFRAEYGNGGWPDLTDPDDRNALELGVTGPPETFFVDAAGVVRYRHIGPLTAEVLDAQLSALGLGP